MAEPPLNHGGKPSIPGRLSRCIQLEKWHTLLRKECLCRLFADALHLLVPMAVPDEMILLIKQRWTSLFGTQAFFSKALLSGDFDIGTVKIQEDFPSFKFWKAGGYSTEKNPWFFNRAAEPKKRWVRRTQCWLRPWDSRRGGFVGDSVGGLLGRNWWNRFCCLGFYLGNEILSTKQKHSCTFHYASCLIRDPYISL